MLKALDAEPGSTTRHNFPIVSMAMCITFLMFIALFCAPMWYAWGTWFGLASRDSNECPTLSDDLSLFCICFLIIWVIWLLYTIPFLFCKNQCNSWSTVAVVATVLSILLWFFPAIIALEDYTNAAENDPYCNPAAQDDYRSLIILSIMGIVYTIISGLLGIIALGQYCARKTQYEEIRTTLVTNANEL
jgi:hypothetical protein